MPLILIELCHANTLLTLDLIDPPPVLIASLQVALCLTAALETLTLRADHRKMRRQTQQLVLKRKERLNQQYVKAVSHFLKEKPHLICERQIQIKMLNASKGPAVRALRAQIDKLKYPRIMLDVMQNTENLTR